MRARTLRWLLLLPLTIFVAGPAQAEESPQAAGSTSSPAKPGYVLTPAQPTNREQEDTFVPARRKDQRQTTPGHILTPAAANIPGIGLTYGILGSAFNLKNSETDVLGFRFWGDLAGVGLGILDIPVWTDDLTINLFWNSFSRAAIESHRRGIKSDKEDRKTIELDSLGVYYMQVSWRLFERRLQLLVAGNRQTSRLAGIRDKDGELISRGNGETNSVFNRSAGFFLDLTDDRSDPRRGFSFETYRYDKPPAGSDQPDYYQMEYNALYYLPIGSYSSWVFNLYRSDAVVTRAGQTDPAEVKKTLQFNCEAVDDPVTRAECESTEQQFVDETVKDNANGTAAPLGGTQRLRSYVTNRYYSAHSFAFGTEFRWNLTEEFTPFNIYLASGVRTGVQLAFFGEGGTVAELPEDLDKNFKYSYGSGVRFILASGFVVRLDLATGSEGMQPTLIFQYPWSVF